jgi:carbonic anhydrase/acetyltransferase-like protein (isoleucine patch superfamily)
MVLRPFGKKRPVMGDDVYVDESAVVIGDVRLHDRVSIWPGAVVRADDDQIEIGEGTAIMDTAFAEAPRGRKVTVGEGCIISHGVRLHGCTIGDGVLIGIGATILDGATIGNGSIVGACALVTQGTTIPANSMVVGSPGKVTKQVAQEDQMWIKAELAAIHDKVRIYRGAR